MIFCGIYEMHKTPNKKIKRLENSWVLPEKQNQIAAVGRSFSSPPLIANVMHQKYRTRKSGKVEIYLNTATINAYENRTKSMNLHFHPIVLFKNAWPFPTSHLKNISWEISSETIGTDFFDVGLSDSPFEIQNEKNYINFHLTKKNVLFRHDDYECQITFRATLDSPHTTPIKIDHTFWGIVKTKWSKGLN